MKIIATIAFLGRQLDLTSAQCVDLLLVVHHLDHRLHSPIGDPRHQLGDEIPCRLSILYELGRRRQGPVERVAAVGQYHRRHEAVRA